MKWYTIQAKTADTAEISIYDEIGGWGISAQQFAKDFKALGNNLKQINLHIDAARNKSISFGAINGILSCYIY